MTPKQRIEAFSAHNQAKISASRDLADRTRAMHTWSGMEEEKLRERYEAFTIKECAELHQRSELAIEFRLIKMGILDEHLQRITETSMKRKFKIGDKVKQKSVTTGWGKIGWIGTITEFGASGNPKIYFENDEHLYIPDTCFDLVKEEKVIMQVAGYSGDHWNIGDIGTIQDDGRVIFDIKWTGTDKRGPDRGDGGWAVYNTKPYIQEEQDSFFKVGDKVEHHCGTKGTVVNAQNKQIKIKFTDGSGGDSWFDEEKFKLQEPDYSDRQWTNNNLKGICDNCGLTWKKHYGKWCLHSHDKPIKVLIAKPESIQIRDAAIATSRCSTVPGSRLLLLL